jgi:hypothetical protein
LAETDVRWLAAYVSRANCDLPNYVRGFLKGALRTRLNHKGPVRITLDGKPPI